MVTADDPGRGPYLRVAVPAPLSQLFDYSLPPACDAAQALPGMRVLVPFGRSRKVGVVVEVSDRTALARQRIRPALQLLDSAPVLGTDILTLARWAADYYVHPLGEVLSGILPPPARRAKQLPAAYPVRWRLRDEHLRPAARARVQFALAELLADAPHGLGEAEIAASAIGREAAGWRRALAAMRERGLVEASTAPPAPGDPTGDDGEGPPLHDEQSAALDELLAALDGFGTFVLDGVTGSGKTEVYLCAIAEVLRRGRQALLLVPEIGLTPQLVNRVRQRFGAPLAVLHSALGDGDRYRVWCAARDGHARIVLGTRSAVFTPLPEPGLIVVDEEHDSSLKQQDGFRYHARDVAVMRAKLAGLPVVLGSATPSLETLANAARLRYRRLRLTRRAGGASFPTLKLVDLRRRGLSEGLSEPLLEALDTHLGNGAQTLVFINRRGFAPTLLCHDCGWVAECRRCDARQTVHRKLGRLECHHCGSGAPLPAQCPECGSEELRPLGAGTQRVEQALAARFPDIPVLRIDRDSTRGRERLDTLLARIDDGSPCVLVGTQMLAKGHHFPHVTLAGIVNADSGLYSVDFRAPEHLAQLVVQVAGRAGRAERPGEVLIQTHNPEHPLLQLLIQRGYEGFAEAALVEREHTQLPPFRRMALLRAEASDESRPHAFLQRLCERHGEAARGAGVELLGPAPAPMGRRAGRFRAQVLLLSEGRTALHGLCERVRGDLESSPASRRVRWSLDVDPTDTY